MNNDNYNFSQQELEQLQEIEELIRNDYPEIELDLIKLKQSLQQYDE